ncbi:MAG: folate-binding protein [Betaproteobacteria bacterium]|nr:folate-binding protein [Betaproteobacteria bacterium]
MSDPSVSLCSSSLPDGPAVFALPHLASLGVAGADARTFLQGQLTNDLLNLPGGNAQLSAWCTAQGRVIANFLLYARPLAEGAEAIRLLLSASLLPDLPQRLGRYALRARVTFAAESGVFAHLGLSGATTEAARLTEILAAADLPDMPNAPLAVSHKGDNSLLRLPDNDRLILTVPEARLDGIQHKLAQSMPLASTDLWRWLDVRHVLPWVSAATSEAFVPQMMNLEKLGGVSFKKGCYSGQEVVARAHYLGQVKRRLYRVASKDSLLAGDGWPKDGAPIGKILQAAPAPEQNGYVALAVLSCKEAEATDAIALSPRAIA